MRLPRHRGRPLYVNLTSLIDVLFILIIFFTVSSTWKEKPVLELELPAAATAESQPVEDLTVLVDRSGQIYFNSQAVGSEELESRMKEALGAMEDEPPLIISADKVAPHGVVVRVLDVAKGLGARRVLLSTTKERKDEE